MCYKDKQLHQNNADFGFPFLMGGLESTINSYLCNISRPSLNPEVTLEKLTGELVAFNLSGKSFSNFATSLLCFFIRVVGITVAWIGIVPLHAG